MCKLTYQCTPPAGHRDLSDSVPDVIRAHNEFQFDEVGTPFALMLYLTARISLGMYHFDKNPV